MATVRARIRDLTERRWANRPLPAVVSDLNRLLRGWDAYFQHGNSLRKFAAIDGYAQRRMAKLASVKYGIPEVSG